MLKVNNVTKIFNKSMNVEDIKVALDNVTVEVNDGDFITVIGGNGSGKSTLLNIISGAHMVESGSIMIDGVDVTNLPQHKRAKYIGIVFQDPMHGTAANMSVLENLLIASRRAKPKKLSWGFDSKLNDEFKKTLSELNLGLENRLNQKIGLLSGGQRQAITLLMATIDKPKLLLLDEHTAALDPKTGKTVLELTERIVSENKLTTIMITHNMRDALRYGNRILMLNEGKIILDASGADKKNLTIEYLLKKFDEDNIVISDTMVLN